MNSHFYFQPSGTGNFLEGDPLLPTPDIDDSAAFKAVFRQGTLHGQIVPVGIDAHIAALLKAPLQAEAPHTPGSAFAPLAGDAVHNAIGDPVITLELSSSPTKKTKVPTTRP